MEIDHGDVHDGSEQQDVCGPHVDEQAQQVLEDGREGSAHVLLF